MKSTAKPWIVAALCIVTLVGIAFFLPIGWEYHVMSIPDEEFSGVTNELGRDGWEVTTARRALDSDTKDAMYELIMKRRRTIWPAKTMQATMTRWKSSPERKAAAAQIALLDELVRVDNSDRTFHKPHCQLTSQTGAIMTAREAIKGDWKPSPDCSPMRP